MGEGLDLEKNWGWGDSIRGYCNSLGKMMTQMRAVTKGVE